MSSSPLDEYDETVLREIADGNRKTDATDLFIAKSDLEDEFGANSPRLGEAIDNLKNKRRYIKDIKAILAAIGDTSIDYEAYQVTALGKNYLAKSQGNSINYTIGGHANIAHLSPGATQSININDLDNDLKQKISELQLATKKKDKSAILKILGYIGDKSVDLLAAIAAGQVKL